MAIDVKGYFLGNGKGAKLAKKHGVEGVHMGHPDGRSGKPNRSIEDVERETAAAMHKDYHVQRTLEAARMAGNKKAQKIGSISNMEEALAAEKFMQKTHSKRMGNGGNYDGANDEGNVTQYWANKDRDKQNAQFASQNDLNSLRDKLESDAGVKEQSDADPQSFEHSDAVADAQDRIDKYELNLFDNNNSTAARTDDQNDAARSFANGYKSDVVKASNLKEDKARNLNNAIDTVKSYRDQFA